jgi:transposase
MEGLFVKFVGIDIGSEAHALAIVDEDGKAVRKTISFKEDAAGYLKLKDSLPPAEEALVGLEATGHYWRNLYLTLVGWGYGVAVINPRRTASFGGEELQRTKTDAVDAGAIARFVREKRPAPHPLPEALHAEIKELVRLRTKLQVDLGSVRNGLHRQLDLAFPEFAKHVKDPTSELALKLLSLYPTAIRLAKKDVEAVALVQYDGRHRVGTDLAQALIEAAKTSVGQHHGTVVELQIRQLIAQAQLLKSQLDEVDRLLAERLDDDDLAGLLRSIPGIGAITAATLIGELDAFKRFAGPDQVVAFLGINPGLRHSGKRAPSHAPMCKVGSRRGRHMIYMATLTAIVHNPVIKAFYQRLVLAGKSKKLAIGACMRKLVHIILAVVRRGKPFTNDLGVQQA